MSTAVAVQVVEKAITQVVSFAAAQAGSEDVAHTGVPFATLAALYEVSGALQTCIEAYSANIDSNGHTLIPAISLEDTSAVELVAQAMYVASITTSDADDDLDDDDGVEPLLPDAAEVVAEVQRLRGRAIRELLRIEKFFKSCGMKLTWTKLRQLRRLDLERFGCAYWEVVREPVDYDTLERDEDGNVVKMARPVLLTRVAPPEIRMTKAGSEVLVYQPILTSLTLVEMRATTQRFRRYKQSVSGEASVTWYKEIGDWRLMSARTGKYYEDAEAMERAEQGAKAATELVHFYLGEGPYGRPRWYGEFQTAVGVRKAQETNVVLLNRGGIPGLAVVISNGSLTDDAKKDLQNWATAGLTGPDSINKMLVIQADGQDNKAKIQIEKLNGQQTDGLYLEYIGMGYELIGRAFRLPKLLRGDSDDVNRSTAEVVLEFAEAQVFAGERRSFDEWMTQFLFEGFDIRLWSFKSNPARMGNPAALGTQVNESVKAGWLMPAEARAMSPEIYGKPLPVLNAAWTKQPLALTLAGMTSEDDPNLDDSLDADDTPEMDELSAAAIDALARLRGAPTT